MAEGFDGLPTPPTRDELLALGRAGFDRNEMVERVAKVLYERNPVAGIPWEDVHEGWRNTARGHARAAIEAMHDFGRMELKSGSNPGYYRPA